MREAILAWEEKLKRAEGRDAFIIKRALIEMRKDQYVIKNAYRKPIVPNKICRSQAPRSLDLDLKRPEVVSAILCNYSRLKQDSWDRFQDDTWYIMQDFDEVATKALAEYPMYERLLEYKIDGLTN